MRKSNFLISVVIPVMNEVENIDPLIEKLKNVLCVYPDHEIIFIDDGSTDETLLSLQKNHEKDEKIKYISFSRNFGHQNALKAGLDYAKGDCVISMDGDFQHPPELIPSMVEKWQEGYEIVNTYRQRKTRSGLLKELSSRIFYKLFDFMTDVNLEEGSADFRLLDRRIVEILKKFKEKPIFFRGLINWLGFEHYGIKYDPEERSAGKTKYSTLKMLKFALEGITGFSVKPLHISISVGAIITFFAFSYGIYALIIRIFTDRSIEGWASLLITISFIGGIQLITIGIIGIYIGSLFMADKERPNYIIKEKSDTE